MKSFNEIEYVLNSEDFYIVGRGKQDGEHYAEIETYSPAGEDVIVTIWHNGTPKSFIEAFRAYAEDFDAEEHAALWIDSRGKNGVPATLRELLDDADAIEGMLLEMARKLIED